MSDFTDDILSAVKTEYDRAVKADKKVAKLLDQIKTATDYKSAYKYSVLLGEHLSEVLKAAFDEIAGDEENEIYYGTAMQLLEPMMKQVHAEVAKQCAIVQNNINVQDGIRVKPQIPELDDFNIRDLARKLAGGAVLSVIAEEMTHFSQKTVDNTIWENAEFDNSLGYEITVTRTYDDVGNHGGTQECEFCKDREGSKTFSSWQDAAGDEIFQRHAGCECTIEYERSGGTKNVVKNYKKKKG